MMVEKEQRVIAVCPRCGEPVSYLSRKRIGRNVYLYAVHWEGKRKRYCYLGPEQYEYASMLHPMPLRGMMPEGDYRRITVYIKELLNALEKCEVKEEQKEVVKRELIEIQQKVIRLWAKLSQA